MPEFQLHGKDETNHHNGSNKGRADIVWTFEQLSTQCGIGRQPAHSRVGAWRAVEDLLQFTAAATDLQLSGHAINTCM
eukprot:scaffold152164_cov22-Prasinocladus_malaysianus.AAC.1